MNSGKHKCTLTTQTLNKCYFYVTFILLKCTMKRVCSFHLHLSNEVHPLVQHFWYFYLYEGFHFSVKIKFSENCYSISFKVYFFCYKHVKSAISCSNNTTEPHLSKVTFQAPIYTCIAIDYDYFMDKWVILVSIMVPIHIHYNIMLYTRTTSPEISKLFGS